MFLEHEPADFPVERAAVNLVQPFEGLAVESKFLENLPALVFGIDLEERIRREVEIDVDITLPAVTTRDGRDFEQIADLDRALERAPIRVIRRAARMTDIAVIGIRIEVSGQIIGDPPF